MSKLQNRVALVTGSGRGIGRSIALAFAAEGAKVAITARSQDELDKVSSRIEQTGSEVFSRRADLSLRTAADDIVRQVTNHFGPIDILVNNAGIGSSADLKPVVGFSDDFWDLTLALNLTAPYLLCKRVLHEMIAQRFGRIIMIASINSKVGAVHGAAYAASKHGLLGLTRSLAMEVAQDGVTVNAVCPGPVRTRMNDARMVYDAKRRGVTFEEHEASVTPIGRRLEPNEIAPMALYLASDEAACVTGQAFNVDGGLVMTG